MRTDLEVSTLADVVIQELEKVVGFLDLEPDDTADEAEADVARFLARQVLESLDTGTEVTIQPT